jgi:DNA anti-recombination protein RmuC
MTARQKDREREDRALRDSVEEVWLAGLGALALAEEEGRSAFRTLMRRGERLERRLVKRGATVERSLEQRIEQQRDELAKAGRARVRDVSTQFEALTGGAMSRVGRGVDEAMSRVLHRIGVPTAKEIDGLTRRVEALRDSLAKGTSHRPARRAHPKRRATTARKTTKRAAETPRLPMPIEPVGADV